MDTTTHARRRIMHSGFNNDNAIADYEPDDKDDDNSDATYSYTSTMDDDEATVEQKYDYLVGPGEMDIPGDVMNNPLFCAWILDDETNLSSIFMNQRRRVLQKATRNEILAISERMALNFIFLFDNDKPTPVFSTKNEWDRVTCTMKDIYPLAEISTPTRDMLYRFSKAAKQNMNSALEVVQQKIDGEPATTATKLLNNMYCPEIRWVELRMYGRRLFYNARVDPIISAFFKNEGDIIIDGCSTTLASSSNSRKRFDRTLQGKIPDLSISTITESTINNIFLMEVEAPNVYTEDADLLKLANMLKDSMDNMHGNGLDSSGGCVFGALVEGINMVDAERIPL
ncbi:hypothetical protein [Absidia glauca]|uniref:Uncharacterized protein n=1 Tax=Absidia glauca TaxID=4829 RepID=A0A168MIU9_ABSGL|nr:hypothetical protein [Absidia glauca]